MLNFEMNKNLEEFKKYGHVNENAWFLFISPLTWLNNLTFDKINNKFKAAIFIILRNQTIFTLLALTKNDRGGRKIEDKVRDLKVTARKSRSPQLCTILMTALTTRFVCVRKAQEALGTF